MQPIAKNNTRCLFKACQQQPRNCNPPTNYGPIEATEGEIETHSRECKSDSLTVQNSVLEMDQLYNSSFFFWIKNAQNAVYIAKRLRPFFFQYSNAQLLRAICWIWNDWEPSVRHKFLRKFIPHDLAEQCCDSEEEEKIVQFLFLINERLSGLA